MMLAAGTLALMASSSVLAEDLAAPRSLTTSQAAFRSGTNPQTANSSSQAAGRSSISSGSTTTLRWRPHRKPDNTVGTTRRSAVQRTQYLESPRPIEASTNTPSLTAPDGATLQWQPNVQEVLVPQVAPSLENEQMPEPSLLDNLPTSPRRTGCDNLDERMRNLPDFLKENRCPTLEEAREHLFRDLDLVKLRLYECGEGPVPNYCTLQSDPFMPRYWGQTIYTWKASGVCHKPLYFEEEALERYGHSLGPVLQPLASGAHFFGTLPILPYKMGINSPWECMYALGYYEAGSCAPYIIDPIPLNVRGALLESGAWTAGVILIP